jgi:hypothetical protein
LAWNCICGDCDGDAAAAAAAAAQDEFERMLRQLLDLPPPPEHAEPAEGAASNCGGKAARRPFRVVLRSEHLHNRPPVVASFVNLRSGKAAAVVKTIFLNNPLLRRRDSPCLSPGRCTHNSTGYRWAALRRDRRFAAAAAAAA